MVSEIADRYRRLCGAFVDKVSQVSPFAQVQDDLDDHERAGTVFAGYFGPMSFEDAIDRFICFDLAIHVVRLRAAVDGFGDALRQSGVCGPPVDVATDADDRTRVLALLARHV